MTAAERSRAYLQIPAEYGGTLGGLVWSASGDAIERWNGTTFAFAEEIRDVLAGVFARPPVPPFEFVLALLRAMRDDTGDGNRLCTAFALKKGVPRLLCHAGHLIAELCAELPSAANPPTTEDVAAAVGWSPLSSMWAIGEVAPLPRDEFARRIETRLAKYDDARLAHWLKFGCDPFGEAEKAAEPLDTLPVRVEKLLAIARSEPRLAGAASLVPALDGALTLPARRRSPDALHQGGYCDVTTRGEPDRLLPGQFALDPDEFIRRFAERELLYFHREEPHATRRPDRLIVLDQGVRTWGGVRLALAAASLVFMRKEAKRVGRVRFATTGSPVPVDVQIADVDSLAKSLESSDLSATPADCLRIARTDADEPRDVILLTHPRALLEPAVQAALASLATEDRVFALAVENSGAAELVQWKESGSEIVRRFRVDLLAAEAVGVPVEPVAPTHAGEWTGDVEPAPFPFRPGLVVPVERMGFDADGEWLVAAGRYGVLQAMGRDAAAPEVLPRAFRKDTVLKTVEVVLGVPGGVVVCGRMESPAYPYDGHFVAAHYDRKSRRVKLHDLGMPCDAIGTWAAHRELNCVMLELPGGRTAAVDLASNEVCTGPSVEEKTRAQVARWKARNGYRSEPYELQVVDQAPDDPIFNPTLQAVANGLVVHIGGGDKIRVMPMQDGKFLLAGGSIVRASLAGNTLAFNQKRGKNRFLITIDCQANRILGETQLGASRDQFALAADGRTIAFTHSNFRTLTAASVGELNRPRLDAHAAGLHDTLRLAFDDKDVLHIGIGQHLHRFTILNGSMRHVVSQEEMMPTVRTASIAETAYDHDRFPTKASVAGYAFSAVADRLGQVLVYGRRGTLLAAVLVRRDHAAVWCPGGIFWGDPALIGGPPTPNAAEAIARFVAESETR